MVVLLRYCSNLALFASGTRKVWFSFTRKVEKKGVGCVTDWYLLSKTACRYLDRKSLLNVWRNSHWFSFWIQTQRNLRSFSTHPTLINTVVTGKSHAIKSQSVFAKKRHSEDVFKYTSPSYITWTNGKIHQPEQNLCAWCGWAEKACKVSLQTILSCIVQQVSYTSLPTFGWKILMARFRM